MLERALSISLAGLAFPATPPLASDPRALIAWAVGFLGKSPIRAVQLDAAMPGIRPRELDRSARRDLASLMRRHGLLFSGLDLWIPPEHLATSSQADRALAAVKGAISLAAELASLTQSPQGRVVCLELPEAPFGDVAGEISQAAQSQAVEIADFRIPREQPTGPTGGPIGIGIDPASLLAIGIDPVSHIAKLNSAPVAARLCDWMGGGRCELGKGKLDRLTYEATLATKGLSRAIVLDLRGLHDADRAAKAALDMTL